MNKPSSHIIVRTRFWGVHRWAKASSRRKYLKLAHAHRFAVELWMPVTHDDRDIEFHDAAELLDDVIAKAKRNPKVLEWSCETWARQIVARMAQRGVLATKCFVWEDDSHGAVFETGH